MSTVGLILFQIEALIHFASVTRDFSYFSTFSANTLMEFVQPLCAFACINICACIKNPQLWQHFGHAEILHTLVGMGSDALAAAVASLK